MARRKSIEVVRGKKKRPQRTYYVGAEYSDHPDRLLVEDESIELYSVDLRLAQHWYAAAWRGNRFDTRPFERQRLDWELDPAQARDIKRSGLVLAQCERHGSGMPVVERINGHPVYGSGVDILIPEVFEAALGLLIEQETGIAGLTISPMHTGYALHDGRPVGKASIEAIAKTVGKEQPDLSVQAAPDGTVTILFSDIEDSAQLNERLGDARWMELLREHNDIIRRHKALHRGFEVKTIGDAFMLAFQSAAEAVRCAIAIQRAFARRNQAASQVLRVRIGIHAGELVREAHDFFGRHVNFAARVAGYAQAEEILVSALLRELVESSGEFTFEARKPVSLKGLKGKHILHALQWRG